MGTDWHSSNNHAPLQTWSRGSSCMSFHRTRTIFQSTADRMDSITSTSDLEGTASCRAACASPFATCQATTSPRSQPDSSPTRAGHGRQRSLNSPAPNSMSTSTGTGWHSSNNHARPQTRSRYSSCTSTQPTLKTFQRTADSIPSTTSTSDSKVMEFRTASYAPQSAICQTTTSQGS